MAISFQCVRTCCNFNLGAMVCWSWWRANWNSRQGLCTRGWPEIVAPGGNSRTKVYELLRQQPHQEFSVEPGPRTLIVILGQVTHRQDGFEPFKHQLNLPPETIVFQHFSRAHLGLEHGGEDDHVAGVFPRLRSALLLFLLFLESNASLRQSDGLLTFPQHTHASGNAPAPRPAIRAPCRRRGSYATSATKREAVLWLRTTAERKCSLAQ